MGRKLTILFGSLPPGIPALIGQAAPESLYGALDCVDQTKPMAYCADLLAGGSRPRRKSGRRCAQTKGKEKAGFEEKPA